MNPYTQGALSWIFWSTEFIAKSFLVTKLWIKNIIKSLSSLPSVTDKDPSVLHSHPFVPAELSQLPSQRLSILSTPLCLHICLPPPLPPPHGCELLKERDLISSSLYASPSPCLQKSPQLCMRWMSIRGVMIELSINQIQWFHLVGRKKALESERCRFQSQLCTGLTVGPQASLVFSSEK